MSSSLRLYLLGITAPAVGGSALLLGFPHAAAGDPILAAILVRLGAIAANFPVMVTKSYKADATPAIELALVVLFPPATAVALVGATRLIGEGVLCLRHNPETGKPRRLPVDLVFNTGQLMIAAAAGASIFRGVLANSPIGDGGGQFLGAIAAAAAMYVTNTALVVC